MAQEVILLALCRNAAAHTWEAGRRFASSALTSAAQTR
jgi:hypothetical protein